MVLKAYGECEATGSLGGSRTTTDQPHPAHTFTRPLAESFLLSNASQITAVESTFRSLTYFLPGRFKDAELAGEAIYSAMNLLGLYHDDILKRLVVYREVGPGSRAAAIKDPKAKAKSASASGSDVPLLPHTPSPHARYTNHYSHSSATYKYLARILVVIGYTELLAEMLARRRLSSKRAWDVVLSIEATKAALRMALFHLTSRRLGINPPIPEREVDPTVLEQEREQILMAQLQIDARADSVAAPSSASAHAQARPLGTTSSSTTWTGSRTGFVRPTLDSLRPPLDEEGVDPAARASAAANGTSRSGSRSRSRSQRHASDSDSDWSDSDLDSDSGRGSSATTAPTTPGTDAGTGDEKRIPRQPWTESSIHDYLTSRALTREDVVPAAELVRPVGRTKRGLLSEYLWMLRPVLYVLALRRWGPRRWEPWVLSLCAEYGSSALRASAYRKLGLGGAGGDDLSSTLSNPLLTSLLSTHPLLRLLLHLLRASTSAPTPASAVEAQEWTSRKRAIVLWYLLRGPPWREYIRPRVHRLCDRFEPKPLLGLPAGMLREYVPLVDELYFYTATQ